MADVTIVARPYAKATFEVAKASKQFEQWTQQLQLAAIIASDNNVQEMLKNPAFSTDRLVDLFKAIAEDKFDQSLINLLLILAENHRLPLLPEIFVQYELMRAEDEKTLTVEVITATEIDDALKTKMEQALSSRFEKSVQAEFSIDNTLIGGAIIRAGDTVIDSSMKNQIDQLGRKLTVTH